MNQRRFLEDDENINGEGRPQKFAASTEAMRLRKPQLDAKSSLGEWLEICSMMLATYLAIGGIWALSMIGINSDFKTTVAIFIGLFILFVLFVVYYWYRGQIQREELIKQMIQRKLSAH